MRRGALGMLLLALGSCEGEGPSRWLVVDTKPLVVDELKAEPARALRSATRSGSRLLLEVASGYDRLKVEVPGACPLGVKLREGDENRVERLVPLLDFGEPQVQLGYGAPLRIEVKPGCDQARAGRIRWQHVSGPKLVGLETRQRGFVLTARTQEASRLLPEPLPPGVVPISPATRGKTTLRASWTDGRRSFERLVVVAAALRASGLPNVTVGQRLLLGGRGWRVAKRPHGARGGIEQQSGLSWFSAEAPGTWQLVDAAGATLSINSGRYDTTPLDCQRCHPSAVASASRSPMSNVLEELLEEEQSSAEYPECALGCHTTGASGIDDGGFASTAHALNLARSELRSWDGLPPALQRQGGVNCLACHGPAMIPEPSARWAILAADVCAQCHDAPPRYGHVAAWRSSAMAHADHDPRTRKDPCARCHTTAGFLFDLGVLLERRPAPRPLGVTCVACHSPHPAPGAVALLRTTPNAERLGVQHDVLSAICVGCHAAQPRDTVPYASAGLMWSGRGGIDPKTGDELSGQAPHLVVPCTRCHHFGDEGLERGGGHRFTASQAVCSECHEQLGSGPADQLAARAAALRERLVRRGILASHAPKAGPLHATPGELDLGTPLGRAAYDVLLVSEDHGASVHNPGYARALLDVAERTLDDGASR